MTKLYLLLITIIIVQTACSDKAVLKVINNTDNFAYFLFEETEKELQSGETFSKDWKLDKTLFTRDKVRVNVEVQETIYVFNRVYDRSIKAGSTFEVKIEIEAGSLKIVNQTNDYVSKLFLSEPGENSWGKNLITTEIAPTKEKRINIEPATYDVKILSNNDEFLYQNQVFREGLTKTYVLTNP